MTRVKVNFLIGTRFRRPVDLWLKTRARKSKRDEMMMSRYLRLEKPTGA